MQISIVIPAYNAVKYLRETVESVVQQSASDWELIIVNDGSTDNTGELARELASGDSRIRVVDKPNGGLSAARNSGYAAASRTSNYICYLDADDVWEPDALEVLSQSLGREPALPAVYGLPCAIDGESLRIRHGELEGLFRNRQAVEGRRLVHWPTERPTTFACEVVFNWVQSAGTLMLRRSAHEAVGGFDERMGGCADWDMWLRICRIGDMGFLNRVVLQYRSHADNMSHKSQLMAMDEQFLRRKLLAWPGSTQEQRQICEWGYRQRSRQVCGYRMAWAYGCLRDGKLLHMARHLRHAIQDYWLYALGPRRRDFVGGDNGAIR
jgi:glycosyltransferase involved in cell wall biosynthesis